MKTISTLILSNSNFKAILFLVMIFVPGTIFAQNMISNPTFSSGKNNWNYSGMNVEVEDETNYGGSNSNNKVAEIDKEVGLRQRVSITRGVSYQFKMRASRRTSGGTMANPGIRLKIYGSSSNTNYINTNKAYSNTSFTFTSEVFTFTVPSNSSDNHVIIEISKNNNNSTLGVIIDDVEMYNLSALSALPVKITSFNAEIRNRNAALSWTTENEINNHHYVVERSSNGTNFDSIGIVIGRNNTAAFTYNFSDKQMKSGSNFYRIRQVDVDGRSTLSKVLVVKNMNSADGIKVFPTAAKTQVNFSTNLENATNVQVMVADASGKIVYRSSRSLTAGSNQQAVSVDQLNNGVYYLVVRDAEGSINQTTSFIKVQ